MFSSLFATVGCSCGNRAKIKFEGYSNDGVNFLQVYTATENEEGKVSDPNYIGSYQFNDKDNFQKVEKGSYVVFALEMDDEQYKLGDFKVLKDGEEVIAVPNYGKGGDLYRRLSLFTWRS